MTALAPELLLATLVVTSLATGGLLGLWAATSPRHWFLRTLVVFAVLTPLLYRPIYEPFVTLLVEVAVVVLGVTIYRRNWPQFRFSIAGLLMLTVPVAVLVAALMRAPEIGFVSWLQIVGMGVVAGAATLLAAWLVRGRRQLRHRVAFALVAIPVLIAAGAACDYLSASFAPFDVKLILNGPLSTFETWLHSLRTALLVTLGMVAVLMLLLPGPLRTSGESSIRNRQRLVAQLAIVLLALYPIYVVFQLSFPIPIPNPAPTASPAYTRLMELAESPQFTAVEATQAPDPVNMAGMRLAVPAADAEFKRARLLLQQPLIVPVNFVDPNMPHMGDIQSRRVLARAWMCMALVARESNDADNALRAVDSILQFVHQMGTQGLLVDLLVTGSIEGVSHKMVYQTIEILDSTQLAALARRLDNYNNNRSSFEPAIRRDEIFSQHAYGWQGHFYDLLDDWTGALDVWSSMEDKDWTLAGRNRTIASLLATKLALRAYQLENNTYPKALADLVPNYLPHVPIDPCSETGQHLLYRRIPEGYQLYSRGCDGDDDDGRPCAQNEYGGTDWTSDGDLSLDAYFAEE